MGSSPELDGAGKVVLARDERIGREVAVKVLHADREAGGSGLALQARSAADRGRAPKAP